MYAELTSHFMLGVVPGGGDGGGYRLGICNPHHGLSNMPCTCTGRLCPKGVPFIRKGRDVTS